MRSQLGAIDVGMLIATGMLVCYGLLYGLLLYVANLPVPCYLRPIVYPTAGPTLTPTAVDTATAAPTQTTAPTFTPFPTAEPTLVPLTGSPSNALLDMYFTSPYNPVMHSPSEIDLSDAGLEFIKSREGYISQKYNDGEPLNSPLFHDQTGSAAGNCTVGYGHLIHIGPCNGGEGWGSGIDEVSATELLQGELETCEEYLKQMVNVKLTQNQYDVIVGLIAGWGRDKVHGSRFLLLLNQGRYAEAGIQLKITAIYGIGCGSAPLPGLVKRREAESKLFLSY